MHRYPRLGLRSKNELAKRIAGGKLSRETALVLINDAIKNFDRYWYDSKSSEPEKKKHVRSAVGNSLGKLLKLINDRVLAPHDELIPRFIFGGVKQRNHIQASHHLLGLKPNRTLLGLDIKSFFEQIQRERIFWLFYKKMACSVKAARLLASICCVPLGPKGSGSPETSLARGFATSPRLALWANRDMFEKMDWKAKRLLKGHDPCLAIFVDDIGVTASNISLVDMRKVSSELEELLAKGDHNQPLPINLAKRKVGIVNAGTEHLGLKLGRRKLSLGRKTVSRRDKVSEQLRHALTKAERDRFLKKRRSYYVYERQVRTS